MATVDGQDVWLQRSGRPGQQGSYVRLCVRCPVHACGSAGMPCQKRRNVHTAQVAALGPNEPIAYLGAWLRAGPSFTDREAHLAHRPSAADTAAFFASQGW